MTLHYYERRVPVSTADARDFYATVQECVKAYHLIEDDADEDVLDQLAHEVFVNLATDSYYAQDVDSNQADFFFKLVFKLASTLLGSAVEVYEYSGR